MEMNPYVVEYFIFVLLATFGTLQLAFSNKKSIRFFIGAVLIFISYVWFFTVRNRNVHSVVEGTQLFLIFAFASLVSILLTKYLKYFYNKR
ncbi:MAG: hypothetical protein A2172_03310 [Candidatus Woykebacteria bacterium RBG_13_40_15]|uniref:Uncharacterized protein n=1 Tax=Candidatus Woykebacteria bacterium RBG_13_40_15 TaxID=1802593 RepID=A0A1G1W5H6_9BACT|nr:MAG: hypothetical protein A2172_03310 [Candidatus Woykebacteria bacterium RBG_13_40_15]